jgi:NAD-dependent SIR2 family protein deacetylase
MFRVHPHSRRRRLVSALWNFYIQRRSSILERPVEGSATAAAFERNPLYVWALYERLRLIARNASPNPGHAALARLARTKPRLLTVTQNIDGT